MLKTLLLNLGLFSLLVSTTVLADEIEDDLSGFTQEVSDDLGGFSDEEDVLDGFEDDIEVDEDLKSPVEDTSPFTLGGNISFKTSVGYKKHKVDRVEYSGFNQAQTSLYLQLDEKLSDNWKIRVSGDMFYDAIYDLRSNQNYSEKILDDYRTQLRFDDVYVQGKLSSDLDLKVGRQIVVWGKSDNIRVTDAINPMDNRLPGMTDIEDLRLSVGMAKLDYYIKQWNFSAMIIPENRIFIEATPRSEFFPVDEVFTVSSAAIDPFTSIDASAISFDNMQYAFAANGVFSGWDFSFYAADVLDQKWHFKEPVRPGVAISERIVSKVKMLGSAFNIAYGSWLFKAEAAFLNGVKYNSTADEKNRLDTLIGLEYMGIKDTSVSFEVANRHIFDYEEQMRDQADFLDKNEVQSAFRLSRSFKNDTINATALLNMFGSQLENGGFARIWVEYELMDALSTNFGVVDYIGGDKPLTEAIKDNDRVFFDIRYSF